MIPDKAYLFDTFVAGRQFYGADDVWGSLRIGTVFQMRGEPENEYDAYAVSLWFDNDGSPVKIGYLPKSSNEMVAVMLAMGWGEAFDCVVSRLDGSAPFERQIGITVRILKKHNDNLEEGDS